MVNCVSCGNDVTGKKFCSECGTPVQSANPAAATQQCPRCNGIVKASAAFCMHCGSALHGQPVAQAAPVAPPPPATHICVACRTEVPIGTAFCTNCGHDMRNIGAPAAPGMQTNYPQPGPYQQMPQQPQYTQYPQQGQYPPAQYPQQPLYGQYQPQPMMGQQPMILRCPVCMAMAPLGTPSCVSCHTSLAGIVPTPANMPAQGQQGGLGGFLQGSGGQMAVGALGGAAAVIGGEMLLHGLENSIEDRVEGDMGYGRRRHHRDEGLLGGLGELADDVGLF